MFSGSRALTALGIFVALVTFSAEAAPAFDPSPYLHPQMLIDVGGHRMNLYCSGRGSPTVVLETAGDDGTAGWRLVQPIIAQHTRVCSYDAPGLGFSDPVAARLDAGFAVSDLHALLSRAGVSGPLVIVGYSLSGLYARLYADRYPHDVAGMVLVSPDVPYQNRRLATAAPALASQLSIMPWIQHCVDAAQHDEIHPGTSAYAQCMYSPPDPTMPRSLLDLIHHQWERPGLWRSLALSMRESDRSSSEVLREQHRYGDMPLIVLTTTKDIASLPIPKSQKMSLARAWVHLHQQIAKLSTRGVDFVVDGSTQAIPIDRPTAVVSAIDEVVDQVRYR